ncbi:choline transport protein [Rutstroemia sp. NJR-2017a WRK4]|nr:choline transport protein [Rutstroemia sp. NJR-2017a WRK4]
MASMIPLSGGQYNWSVLILQHDMLHLPVQDSLILNLGLLSYHRLLARISEMWSGWVTVIAWQATNTSSTFLAAEMIQGLAVLNYPEYDAKRWHAVLLMYAIMALAVFVNTYLASQLPAVESLILIIHILGFFAILIPLVHLAPHGTASDVFETFLNEGEWSSKGLAFFVGLMTAIFALIGVDGAAHMAEEIQNASTVIPHSMICTVILNGILGFAMLIAVLFCAGNIEDALQSPTGFPFIEIFNQATGSISGATGMTVIIVLAQILACIGIIATATRMTWAFTREKVMNPHATDPSGLKANDDQVEPKTALPLWSIGLTMTITILLSLINLGSSTALNAVLSLVTAGCYSSILLACVVLLIKRCLGALGLPINIISVAWTTIGLLFSFWPTTSSVDAQDMNWSILIYGSVLILSTVFWFAHSRHIYTGPVVEISYD